MSEGMKISTSDFVYNYLMGRPSILKKKGGMGFKIRYSLPIKYRLSGKESVCQCRRRRFDPWVRKIPGRKKWQPIPALWAEKSHGQRRLVGYSPWGCKESDTAQSTHTKCGSPDEPLTALWLNVYGFRLFKFTLKSSSNTAINTASDNSCQAVN